jgi:SAM-dependent methyltransferase
MLKPAEVYAATRDWEGYFAAVAGKGARETLVDGLEVAEREGGAGLGAGGARELPLAIDLGAGEGRDTAELLRRGWRVLAIDDHASAERLIRERTDVEAGAWGRLRFERCDFAGIGPGGLRLPPARLINASFALPFCPPGHFATLWAEMCGALVPGGLLCGQLFGDKDTWATLPDRTHHTREQVMALLEPFAIVSMREEDKPGKEFDGKSKHWHVFHVVARRRGEIKE